MSFFKQFPKVQYDLNRTGVKQKEQQNKNRGHGAQQSGLIMKPIFKKLGQGLAVAGNDTVMSKSSGNQAPVKVRTNQ